MERALPASGRTEVSPTLARAFAAWGLLLLAAVPAAQHLPSLDAGPFGPFLADFAAVLRPPDDGGRLFFAVNRRLQARMEALERGLEEGSWILARTQGAVQWLLAGRGGAGNEQVYVGRGGWLVYRPGFDYVTGPPLLAPDVLERRRRAGPSWSAAPASDPRPAILDFHRQLAERGVRLIVVPAPTKLMVHPEALASAGSRGAGTPALHNPSFAELRAAFEDAGIQVYDPTETLLRLREREGAFLRTDSHWSPGAVDAVARELADRVRLLGLPFAGPEVAWQRRAVDVEGVGDLALTLRLPAWGKLYPPEPARLERVAGPDGRPWQADPRAEVLVLGDSFTNVFSEPGLGWGRAAGLAEQLAFHLGRGVDRIALNDDGAAASRRRLAQELAAGRERLRGKRLVVWEFAVRELAAGDWQTIALQTVALPPIPPEDVQE
ncbi:MAG TPA: hypothetical protein VGG06_20200 [Thermoanaerobaculia bacterium]|jgi:alginate O-acetyltransferase complex protein AlgJ